MHLTATSTARLAGVLLGAGLAVLLLVAARPSSSYDALGARASIAAGATGELAVLPAPPRPVLDAPALEPGGPPARGTLELRNQTAVTLGVGFKAEAESRDLDGLLRIRLLSGGRVLAETTLQGLRAGVAPALVLAVGAGSRVDVEAWIPAGISDGFQGRSVAVTLVPTVSVQG